MSGPAAQNKYTFAIPPGESQAQYPVGVFAREIENMEFTSDETLISVTGPTIYEPVDGAAPPAYRSQNIHSVFHTTLSGGLVDLLLVRWGDRIYWHNGWQQTYAGLTSIEGTPVPLSDELRPAYPDQYVVLNDRVIWTNGVDNARIITYDGMSFPLGFNTYAPTPTARSPVPVPTVAAGKVLAAGVLSEGFNGDASLARYQQEPNYRGYSWPGKIGTIADVLDGTTGCVQAGTWFYHAQLEDFFGNLGPLSTASNPARLATANSGPPAIRIQSKVSWFGRAIKGATAADDTFANAPDTDNTEIDDLLKQFCVSVGGEMPPNTAAVRLYRTSDTKNVGAEPKLLARVPGARVSIYPDNVPDEYLGLPAEETIPVPIFRVMCTHQGRLVVGNTIGEPGIVRRSEPGFPGTFLRSEFTFPDAGAAEVTAVTSHNGLLLAFTEDTVYSLQEFGAPQPLSQGIGCVAPRSIVALPTGLLVWLGRDGFYGLAPGGAVERLSEPVDRTTHHYLSKGRMRRAVAAYNYEAREYQCAVAEAGSNENNLMLCFGQGGWRRKRLGLAVRDICTTRDWRKYSLIAAKELPGITKRASFIQPHAQTNDVYVLDRETVDYTPPDRVVRYRSNWIRAEKAGLTPMQLRTMYVGMLDSFDGDVTVKFYRNGSWAEVVSMADLKAVGTDDGQGIVADVAGSAVIGSSRTRDPRLFWRQVPMQLRDARMWAFEIETTGDQALHLAAVGFDFSVATMGNPNSRVPRRSDV
jgi:hypothetical protein